MEWAEGGDTYSLFSPKHSRHASFKRAGEEAVRFILACVVSGMEYLHNCSIMYRDLKPENALIFSNGYVKLTDFGLAKEVKENELSRCEAGTTIYFAPEMAMREKGYTKHIDMWTVGVLAYELANYKPPFAASDIRQTSKFVKLVKKAEKQRVWHNPNLSPELKDFINSLLKFCPKERLGYRCWSEIKQHRFFTCVDFDWKALESMEMESPLKPIVEKHRIDYERYSEGGWFNETQPAPVRDDRILQWTYHHPHHPTN